MSSQQQDHGGFVLETIVTDTKMLQLLQYITEALVTGSVKRPPLPIEMLRQIFSIGGFIVHEPDMDKYMDETNLVHADDGIAKRNCWMVSKPLDSKFTARPGGVRLTTVSHHQGWVSLPDQGSWSWFELAVIPPQTEGSEENNRSSYSYDRIKCRTDGSPLTWVSHRHPVNSRRDPKEYVGLFFDANHELWSFVTPGDRLAVFACAQYPGWSCEGESARLSFFAPYDPTL